MFGPSLTLRVRIGRFISAARLTPSISIMKVQCGTAHLDTKLDVFELVHEVMWIASAHSSHARDFPN